MTVSFSGSIYSVRSDREGYSKVVLEVPRSDLKAILKLQEDYLAEELRFTVRKAKRGEVNDIPFN